MQGKKAKDGAVGLKHVTVNLTEEQVPKFKSLGGSAWLRQQIDQAELKPGSEPKLVSDQKPDSNPKPNRIDIPPAMAWAIADMRASRQPHELIDIPDEEALQDAIQHFAAVQAEFDAAASRGDGSAAFKLRLKLQEASRLLKKANGIVEPVSEAKPKFVGNPNLGG